MHDGRRRQHCPFFAIDPCRSHQFTSCCRTRTVSTNYGVGCRCAIFNRCSNTLRTRRLRTGCRSWRRRGRLSREGASRAHLPRLHGYAGHGDGGDRQLHARVPPDVGGMLLVTGLLRLADVPTMYMWCRGDSLSVMLHPDCTASVICEHNDCDSAWLP